MTTVSANHRAVIVIEDPTLRGYAKLALLYAEVPVSALSMTELVDDLNAIADSVMLLDSAAHSALLHAASSDDSLARRIVLFDPAAAVPDAQRQYTYAILDRIEAESLVTSVRDCLAAFAASQPPMLSIAEPAAEAVRAVVAPVKKVARKVLGKKPKRKR
jgi:hypothetical protein